MADERGDPGAGLWRALASTEGAILLGAALVTGAVTQTPVFFALGGLGYGIVSLNRWRELRAQGAERARYRVPLPPAIEKLGPRARRVAEEGWRGAQAALDEVAAGEKFLKNLFEPAVASVRGLFEKYVALARRLEEIERYSDTFQAQKLAAEYKSLRDRAERAGDEQARGQYLAAAGSIEETLANHAELERDARRIEAQMAAIRAAFDNARAKVVRVKSVEARGAAGEGEAVAEALGRLGGEVDALSSAVDEVFVRAKKGPPPRERSRGG